MSTQSTAQHETFAASAERLADEHVMIGALVAEIAERKRRGRTTGAKVEEMQLRMSEFITNVEGLRRLHFPDAHELVIVDNSAYLESVIGQSARLVWSRTQADS